MITPSPTPKTDEAESLWSASSESSGVSTAFARGLELELSAALKEVEGLESINYFRGKALKSLTAQIEEFRTEANTIADSVERLTTFMSENCPESIAGENACDCAIRVIKILRSQTKS